MPLGFFMTVFALDSTISSTADLLTYYSIESESLSKDKLLDSWLRTYPVPWVRLALIEALHQGRYKTISVAQLLDFWQRRGEPIYHFSHDFEVLVSKNLPKIFLQSNPSSSHPTPITEMEWDETQFDLQAEESEKPGSAHPQFTPEFPHEPKPKVSSSPPSMPDSLDSPEASIEPSANNAFIPSAQPARPTLESSEQLAAEHTNHAEDHRDIANLRHQDSTGSPPQVLPNCLPIHQFTPSAEPSGFYDKLTAILQHSYAHSTSA